MRHPCQEGRFPLTDALGPGMIPSRSPAVCQTPPGEMAIQTASARPRRTRLTVFKRTPALSGDFLYCRASPLTSLATALAALDCLILLSVCGPTRLTHISTHNCAGP
jgi:hypothetical protein